jgi:NSS family neurotransmitter:Na+ symporter
LGSIWRFPYVVGENGGATFVILYLVCLLLVGLPVLVTEILIGRTSALNPSGAFYHLGKKKAWRAFGMMTILTGVLVSSFYAVVAGWTLGFLFEALLGQLTHFTNTQEVHHHFITVSSSPFYSVGWLFGFLAISFLILYTGVRKGIEASNKIMMPLLLVVLVGLAIKGLMIPGGERGITFIFKPDWSHVTPTAILIALGQAFFSLSLGQGTMVTYGSYVKPDENIPGTCVPITLFGICISLLAGIAIFTIVFSFGMPPATGESLMFQTLPLIFSQIPGGYLLCLLFFLLLLLAALTSQISAMEPLISYLIDTKKWSRHKAALLTGAVVFIIGVPCSLSFGLLGNFTFFGKSFFHLLLFLCLHILIPIGALAATFLVGWRWGIKKALLHLKEGTGALFQNYPVLQIYFRLTIKYLAPLIIIVIMLDALGII